MSHETENKYVIMKFNSNEADEEYTYDDLNLVTLLAEKFHKWN